MLSGSIKRISVALFMLCLTCSGTAAAQIASNVPAPTGAITGTATDETGAAIADVRITVTNDATALRREVTTGEAGTFTVPQLPAGQYTLRAEREGFAAHDISGIVVKADAPVTLQIQMKVAGLSDAVVVTAQKRGDERLVDVPVPVSAVGGQKLADNDQLRLRDFFSSVAGLSVSPEITGSQVVAIRGVSSSRAEIPTVSALVDEVPFGLSLYQAGALPDIDPTNLARIEVLRGPQGTLYGANSMGGLIKYVTLEPSSAAYSGRVSAGFNSVHNGDGPGYSTRAAANVPLSSTFAIRVSGFARQDPGYVDNPARGIDGVNTVRTSGGLLAASWRPSEAVSLRLSGLYHDAHGDGAPDVDVLPGLGDLQQSSVVDIGQYDRTIQAYSAVLKARLGRIDLTSVTGYNVNQGSDAYDYTGRFGSLSRSSFGVADNAVYIDFRASKVVQEFRVSAPVAQHVDVLVGAFYTHERYGDYQSDRALTPAGATVGELYSQSVTATDPYDTYSEYAGFANLIYRFTDRFDVQLGARQSHARATQAERVRTGPLFGLSAGQQSIAPALASTTNASTYLVTPRFKVSPTLMTYARFASGYRPGLFNPNATGPSGSAPNIPSSFDSDSIKTYEVGIKGEFLDRRLFLDASLYYIDWKNLQLQVIDPASRLGYKTNAGSARSDGVELSVTTRPLTGLTVDAWVDYDDAVLTEPFPAGSSVIGASGDRLPFSSRYSGNVSIEQEFPLFAEWRGVVSGAVSYVDDRLGNFRGASPPRQRFPGYTKTDVGAGLKHDDWMVNFFVSNVADTRGVLSYGFYPPYRATYIQPRTVGLTLTRSF